MSGFSKYPEYIRNYYWTHREHMIETSLRAYYRRKEILATDPKKEYEKIMKLFEKKREKEEKE